MTEPEAWSEYVHSTEVRVRVADTDLMGVVYNSNFLVWFEIGRTEWIRSRGISYAEVERSGFSLPVIEARFRVRQPARYDDLVSIETTVLYLNRRQVRFGYRISRTGVTLVEGESLHVPVRHDQGRAVVFPDRLFAAMRGR